MTVSEGGRDLETSSWSGHVIARCEKFNTVAFHGEPARSPARRGERRGVVLGFRPIAAHRVVGAVVLWTSRCTDRFYRLLHVSVCNFYPHASSVTGGSLVLVSQVSLIITNRS